MVFRPIFFGRITPSLINAYNVVRLTDSNRQASRTSMSSLSLFCSFSAACGPLLARACRAFAANKAQRRTENQKG